jgi:hypothetical protein
MPERKHTPLTSIAERGLYGAAYGAKKAGKPKPDFVPASVWGLSLAVLKFHLEESAGRKLTEHV